MIFENENLKGTREKEPNLISFPLAHNKIFDIFFFKIILTPPHEKKTEISFFLHHLNPTKKVSNLVSILVLFIFRSPDLLSSINLSSTPHLRN